MLGCVLYWRYVGLKHTYTHNTSSKLVQRVQNVRSLYAFECLQKSQAYVCPLTLNMYSCVFLQIIINQLFVYWTFCSLLYLLSCDLCPSSNWFQLNFPFISLGPSLSAEFPVIPFVSLCHAKSLINMRVLHRWEWEWQQERNEKNKIIIIKINQRTKNR